MTNPWSLSDREIEVMRSYIELGRQKIVASELGISDKTVSEHLRGVMQKMGTRVRVIALLEFDRWVRRMTTQRHLCEPGDMLQVGGDFVDSHAPFDGEVVTDAPWPVPAPRKWEPKAEPSWRATLKRWLGGAA